MPMRAMGLRYPSVSTRPPSRIWHALVPFGTAAVILFALWLKHISVPRIVASAIAPDGTELRVVQTCNWSLEPFTTEVYYRKPGGQLGWFYYDHEDLYWGSGAAELDLAAKRINIKRGGNITATFAWDTETFELRRLNRTMVGAQDWQAPPVAAR